VLRWCRQEAQPRHSVLLGPKVLLARGCEGARVVLPCSRAACGRTEPGCRSTALASWALTEASDWSLAAVRLLLWPEEGCGVRDNSGGLALDW